VIKPGIRGVWSYGEDPCRVVNIEYTDGSEDSINGLHYDALVAYIKEGLE